MTKLKLKNPRVHGEYPNDRRYDEKNECFFRWYHWRFISGAQAAEILGFSVEALTSVQREALEFGNWYPFLNKGFIALDDSGKLTPESQSQDREGLPYGTRAITLCDGRFSIVRKRNENERELNGQGKQTTFEGDIEEGEFWEGELHGQGKRINANGEVEEGEFKEGNLNGKGQITYPCGRIECGEFCESVLVKGTSTQPTERQKVQQALQRESQDLQLTIENDETHHNQHNSIRLNLVKKLAAGAYSIEKAGKLFMYLVNAGSKKYLRDFGNQNGQGTHAFNIQTRRRTAASMECEFRDEVKGDAWDHLLSGVHEKRAEAQGGLAHIAATVEIQQL